MLYAYDIEGNKIPASKDAIGVCPDCGGLLMPKCGEIMVHHWAHYPNSTEPCSMRDYGETQWHLWWKSLFPKEWVEVKIGNNRADIRTPFGKVVELLVDMCNAGYRVKKAMQLVEDLWGE